MHGLEADFLLLVFDDHPPHARVAGGHDTPKADVASGERLRLEPNVLQDVRQVRPLRQPAGKPTGFAARARMLPKRRHVRKQSLAETWYPVGRNVVQLAESDVARDHWGKAPVVWS